MGGSSLQWERSEADASCSEKCWPKKMGTSAYPLQQEPGFFLYRCSCKIEKTIGLMRDAVFRAPEVDIHVLGAGLLRPSVQPVHSVCPSAGCYQDSGTRLGLREAIVTSQHLHAQKEECCPAGCHRNLVDEMSISYPSRRHWACWFV